MKSTYTCVCAKLQRGKEDSRGSWLGTQQTVLCWGGGKVVILTTQLGLTQENDNLLDSRSYRVTDKSVNLYFARYQFISFSLNYYKVIAMGMKYIIVYIT